MFLFDLDMPESSTVPLDVQLMSAFESYGSRAQQHIWREHLGDEARKQLKKYHGMKRGQAIITMTREQKEEEGLL